MEPDSRLSPMRTARTAGMSMVEIMIAITILAMVLLGSYILIVSSLQLQEHTYEINTATFDMQSAIGYVRSRTFNNIFNDIPQDSVLPTSLYSDSAWGTSMTHLRDQIIRVEYLQSVGGAAYTTLPGQPPDPLVFRVNCSWNGVGGNSREESITCIRTK